MILPIQNTTLSNEIIDLHKAKQRLELVLEGTRLGMWDWNPQTNEVYFDQRWAEMLGYDLSEVEQHLKSWQDKVHPDDLVKCFEDIQAHIQGHKDFYENIHRMRHKDGYWVYILDRGKIVERDADGNPIRFTGTHTDITREKLAELKPLEASKAKSYFLANMSHEIRTPLHGILGLTKVLSGEDLEEENHKIVRTIQEAGNSLLAILNDILDISKLDEHKLSFNPIHFNFKVFLQECIDIFKPRILAKGLQFSLNLTDSCLEGMRDTSFDDLYLLGDKNRIRKVLSNLISNAIKFKFIALTADAFEETKKHCLSVGFDYFLSKPISIEELNKILYL